MQEPVPACLVAWLLLCALQVTHLCIIVVLGVELLSLGVVAGDVKAADLHGGRGDRGVDVICTALDCLKSVIWQRGGC